MRALESEFPDMRLLAITPQGPELHRELKQKIAADGEGGFPWTILFDEGSRVIDLYGLRDPAYADSDNDGLPHPAVFVLDPDRRVTWSRVESNYRERPELDEIRQAISQEHDSRFSKRSDDV